MGSTVAPVDGTADDVNRDIPKVDAGTGRGKRRSKKAHRDSIELLESTSSKGCKRKEIRGGGHPTPDTSAITLAVIAGAAVDVRLRTPAHAESGSLRLIPLV